MLAKILENGVNRKINVRFSYEVIEFCFVVVADLAKVPMPKIYGSDSVPEKVIKILSITYGIPVRRRQTLMSDGVFSWQGM